MKGLETASVDLSSITVVICNVCNNAEKSKLYTSVRLCVIVCVHVHIDEEVEGDFVLSLALTVQTKTKSHKLHDLDQNLLLLPLAFFL